MIRDRLVQILNSEYISFSTACNMVATELENLRCDKCKHWMRGIRWDHCENLTSPASAADEVGETVPADFFCALFEAK